MINARYESMAATMKPTDLFVRHPVFRFEEFREAHQSGGTRSETTGSVLKQHVTAGNLINVRRGLYARVPEGAGAAIFQVETRTWWPGASPLTRHRANGNRGAE